jgi:hypothetical protein
MSRPLSCNRSFSSERLRAVLAARGLSLAEISRQAHARFGANRAFRIPPNFYDALRHGSFTPSLHQLYAFSVLTGFRVVDWLALFDFSLDDPARFQSAWRHHRTVELDADIYDQTMVIPWFEEQNPIVLGAGLVPLSRWLSGSALRGLDSLSDNLAPSFRYLQIGSRDAYAFPDLLPGSIVRVDGRLTWNALPPEKLAKSILAIEHSGGIACSRVRRLASNRIVLCPRQLPYAPLGLELGAEARILGVVDLEIRRVASLEAPKISAAATQLSKPGPLMPTAATGGRFGASLRLARTRCGLSFREASARTAHVARSLGHANYFCSAGSLSDFEAGDRFPRHFHKLISLSAVYCVPIADLMGLAGLPLAQAGRDPMPKDLTGTLRPAARHPELRGSPFLQAIESQFEEIPFFLWSALPSVLGLPNLSVRDIFWAGATRDVGHPYLRDSGLLAVNRKSKTPAASLSSPVWAQPLYVLELRNGNRLCAACSLHNGMLLVRPCTTRTGDVLRLRNRIDAEVLGKVVAVVRRLRPIDAIANEAHSRPSS